MTGPRLFLVALLVLAACSPPAGEGTQSPDVTVEVGAELYARSCAECHGPDLRGTASGPSFLSIVYEPGHHPDAAFHLAVAQGVRPHHWNFGPMLPIPGLSTEEVDAIVAFVRETQRAEGFEPYSP